MSAPGIKKDTKAAGKTAGEGKKADTTERSAGDSKHTQPRLRVKYDTEIRDALKASLGLANVMEVPRITKIVVNAGVGKATAQPSLLDGAVKTSSESRARSPR